MIRDEFLKEQQGKFTDKDLIKMQTMGKRAYLTSSISKATANIKVIDFSTWFAFIASVVGVLITLVGYLLSNTLLFDTTAIILYTFIAVFLVWTPVWFFIIKVIMKKRIDYFRLELKKLSDEEAEKRAKQYQFLNGNK